MKSDQRPELLQRDILNLGCGRKHLPGAVNLDVTSATDPDIVHDLNVHPWPFPDNQFREIHAYDVVEHLADVMATMEEVHRVSRPQAIVRITVPHFSCCNAFADPTHRHFFTSAAFDYFTDDSDLNFYTQARFRIVSRQIFFYPSLMNKLVWRLANRYRQAYEQRWAWRFPAWFIQFHLEVLK